MSGKIYCGSGKEKVFNNGGSLVEVLLDVDELAKNFKEHGFTTKQGKRKIRVKVCQSREVDQYGNTHYVEVDTWKPKQGGPPSPQQQGGQSRQDNQSVPRNDYQSSQAPPRYEDDIPF